jgi:hypothetical protein
MVASSLLPPSLAEETQQEMMGFPWIFPWIFHGDFQVFFQRLGFSMWISRRFKHGDGTRGNKHHPTMGSPTG